MLLFVLILLGLIIAFVVTVVGMYNGLIVLRNRVKNSWSQIDVQLKRRHDLIPNLVQTVKGYATHEKETLENVTTARAQAMNANAGKNVKDISAAESELSGSLAKLLMTVENYPDLKANESFMALQEELTSTENKIAFSRQAYNDDVMFYNNKIELFPSNFIANAFNFKASQFFEIENKEEKNVPDVKF